MLRKMTTIGLALGLLLPGSAILAETAQDQKENQVRTEKQEMVQTGSQAAGELERSRTREEKQTRDQSGDAMKQQKQKGSSTNAAGDQLRDRDQVKDKDQVRDRDRIYEHQGSGTQTRGGGR